jgi:hypothetical protein
MAPFVGTNTAQADCRAGKSLQQREAKVLHQPRSRQLH